VSTFNEGRGEKEKIKKDNLYKNWCAFNVIFAHVITSLEYLNEFQNLTIQIRDIE